MAQLTDFGKTVRKALIDKDEKPDWLVQEIRAKTGLYMDTAYLAKILSGQRCAPRVQGAIREILDIPEATR